MVPPNDHVCVCLEMDFILNIYNQISNSSREVMINNIISLYIYRNKYVCIYIYVYIYIHICIYHNIHVHIYI